MRPNFIQWLAGTVPQIADVANDVDDLARHLIVDARAQALAEVSSATNRLSGLILDATLNDLQSAWRGAVHVTLAKSYQSSFFVGKALLERCVGFADLTRDAGAALGDDAKANLRTTLVLVQPPLSTLPFTNCAELRLCVDRIGVLLQTETEGVEVIALLQFALRFTGRLAQATSSRFSQVAASDPAIVTVVAEKLDSMIAVRTPKPFSVPDLSLLGLTAQTPTDIIAHEVGMTVVCAESTLGTTTHFIPDSSRDIGAFDACFLVEKGQVFQALQSRVASLGSRLTADYRPASAGVRDLRFITGQQAIIASIGISVMQQGGENPCEWEVPTSQSVEVRIRPERRGAAHFVLTASIISSSGISWSFRWRQDVGCGLFLPGPIVSGLAHLFTNFSNDLAGYPIPGIDIAPANVTYLDVQVRDEGLLVLANLASC